jgi:hypothetical protein
VFTAPNIKESEREEPLDQHSILHNIWINLAVWSILYLGDYYFTIFTAKLYRENVSRHIFIEGSLEITPQYQEDVDRLRWISPRFIRNWLLSTAYLLGVWWLSRAVELPQFLDFILGTVFLAEGAIHLRHIRNYGTYKFYSEEAMEGRIRYSRWYVLKISAWELFGFGFFFLLFAVTLGSWFFLGGVLGCWIAANKHRILAKKALKSSQEDPTTKFENTQEPT